MNKYCYQIKDFFKANQILWRKHALTRMLERDISRNDVFAAVENGEPIEFYPDSKPFPGCLIFGYSNSRPLHVLSSVDMDNKLVYVITAYVPDTIYFEDDFKTRKGRGS